MTGRGILRHGCVCQALAKERDECLPADVQLWAKQGGKGTLLANMCLGAREYSEEYPTEEVREKWRYVFENGETVIKDTKEELLEEIGKDKLFCKSRGDVYVDGSCL